MSLWSHSGDVIDDMKYSEVLADIKYMKSMGINDDEIIEKLASEYSLEGSGFDQLCNMVEEN